MTQEKVLLERLARGDRGALRCIYETNRKTLMTVAVCLLGDEGAAEDCLQDVFVTLASGNVRLKPATSLRNYLVAAVANRAKDVLRKRAVRGNGTNVERLLEVASETGDPGENVATKELIAEAYKMLSRLPDEQREAVTLHLLGDMTFAEIARGRGMSINTVQSRYRYALQRLRALWKERDLK